MTPYYDHKFKPKTKWVRDLLALRKKGIFPLLTVDEILTEKQKRRGNNHEL